MRKRSRLKGAVKRWLEDILFVLGIFFFLWIISTGLLALLSPFSRILNSIGN